MAETQTDTTLFDWLMQFTGMSERIAEVIDDEVPDVIECPSARDLWNVAGFSNTVSERQEDYNRRLQEAIDFWLDEVEKGRAGETYGALYRDRVAHYSNVLWLRGESEEGVGNKAPRRARRAVAQAFLGHVWEAAYRLEMGEKPPRQFARPMPPEVPYPEVAKETS